MCGVMQVTSCSHISLVIIYFNQHFVPTVSVLILKFLALIAIRLINCSFYKVSYLIFLGLSVGL